MNDFLSKLSSYNVFNYLIPGVVFAVLVDANTEYKFLQHDVFVGLIFYYFIGLVVSRIGSLFIEPLLRKVGFIEFAAYEEFMDASKRDEKLETLSEANNTYRTFVAAFLCVLLVKGVSGIARSLHLMAGSISVLNIVFLLILFAFSYRKQTAYLVRRIKGGNERAQGEDG